jgi:ABC-type nitrate/sulfonate/bicarbonate transport system substrate-binding protein
MNRRRVPFLPPPPIDDLRWLGVDFDNTIAETFDYADRTVGYPIQSALEKMERARVAGYKIAVWTARPWSDYELIEAWLNHYGIDFDRIECGKMLVRAMVDDRAISASAESWLPEDHEIG